MRLQPVPQLYPYQLPARTQMVFPQAFLCFCRNGGVFSSGQVCLHKPSFSPLAAHPWQAFKAPDPGKAEQLEKILYANAVCRKVMACQPSIECANPPPVQPHKNLWKSTTLHKYVF